jgi:hypothetical protein
MASKAVITTPFPTVRETAREMGVAEARVRWLSKLILAIVAGRDLAAASRAKRRVAARRRTTTRKRAASR